MNDKRRYKADAKDRKRMPSCPRPSRLEIGYIFEKRNLPSWLIDNPKSIALRLWPDLSNITMTVQLR